MGIESPNPVLNWACESDEIGDFQCAYHILVSVTKKALAEDRGTVWDSSEVSGEQSCGIPLKSVVLDSATRYFWKVRVRSKDGSWSSWSEVAWFETGLLKPDDWQAAWIQVPVPRFPPKQESSDPAPWFRKYLHLNERPRAVRAYVSGLGYFELFINGEKSGDRVLSPPVSQYDSSIYYESYDVSAFFEKGENVIAAVLGNGWYNINSSDAWGFEKAPWRDNPKLLLQLEFFYENGRKERIISDTTWKVSYGPIRFDCLKNGEHYDARIDVSKWLRPGFDDSAWHYAQIARPPGGRLRSAQLPPIREIREIAPVSVSETKSGTYVFDFGQNISGYGRISTNALEGREIVIKYGERLDANGSLDTRDIAQFISSGEFQTDRYVADGGAKQQWKPRFTYHGFQYAEVTGLDRIDENNSVVAVVVHTDLQDAGAFESSDELLNTIQTLARRSTLTNYHGFPTDCPHREKNGWTGDALLSAEQVLLNFDPVTAYRKWLIDIVDAQRPSGQIPGIVPSGGWGYNWGSGPAWDSALILIPWYTYLYSADRVILEQNYQAMLRYLNFLDSMTSNGIADFGLGDWCPPADGPNDHKCPSAVTDTGYVYVDFITVAKISRILGEKNQARRLEKRAGEVRSAFRKSFFDPSSGSVAGNSQTALACALYQGMIDDDEAEHVFSNLVDAVEETNRHLDTGILGSKYLLHTLSRFDRTDLAYAVASQRDSPSWGYWIEQGATSLWERWDGKDSRNHHMYSDISAWFYRDLAGIRPDEAEPGFKNSIFRPNPVSGLSWAKAHHISPFGRIECEWMVNDDGFSMRILIPANCRGSLSLPREYSANVRVNGEPRSLKDIARERVSRRPVLRFASGSYEIRSEQ